MEDCCGTGGDAGARSDAGSERYNAVFGVRFAQRLARQYTRRGLTKPEQRIVDYLVDEVGIEGARVLEIGGGVGELQLALLERGARSALNLELSSAYEETATRLAEAAGVGDRVMREVGIDLAERPDAVDSVDLVVLHRVVCCYPDAERLLAAAADRADRALVFSHPPRNPVTRISVAAVNLMMRLRGRSYRGYVHSPDAMIQVLARHGLQPGYRHQDRAWCIVGARR